MGILRALWGSYAVLFFTPVILMGGMVIYSSLTYEVNDFSRTVAGGDIEAGAEAITHFGCSSCHTIEGIESANSTVGPPLNDYSRRLYIAGAVPNVEANLILWIMNPQAI